MESHEPSTDHPAHARHPIAEHRHRPPRIDGSYRLVVRTVLWVIAGLVFLGFAIWWALT